MGQTLQAGVASGLALAGFLAIAGIAAARFGRDLPHLGVGAVGLAVASSAGRLTTVHAAVMALILVGGGTVLGVVAATVDERIRTTTRSLWPPPLLADAAVLALAVGVAAILRPPLTVDLAVGPLGGFPPLPEAVAALVVGLAGAAVISSLGVRYRADVLTWAIVAAVVAVVAVLGSGALALRTQALAPVFAVVDVAGLSVRAAAVGVVARQGAVWGVTAALVLGVGEGLLTNSGVWPHVGLVPALLVLGTGLALAARAGRVGAS